VKFEGSAKQNNTCFYKQVSQGYSVKESGFHNLKQISWWIWEILDKYPALVRYYSEGVLRVLRFCVIIIYCALN
jgi:hypothetical protein